MPAEDPASGGSVTTSSVAHQIIIVLDFGSQYTQLIARRLRELSVYCEILPFDTTSRRIVPELEAANYSVRFKEFDGPHTVPAPIAREAFEWIAGRR